MWGEGRTFREKRRLKVRDGNKHVLNVQIAASSDILGLLRRIPPVNDSVTMILCFLFHRIIFTESLMVDLNGYTQVQIKDCSEAS
jgi:hypothetical protein